MLEIRDSRVGRYENVRVDYGYFDRYRKPNINQNKSDRSRMVYPKISLRNKHTVFEDQSSPEQDGDDRFNSKVPKPILRRRSFNENEKTRPGTSDGKDEIPEKKGNSRGKEAEIPDELRLPTKETTINGIPLSKLPREKAEKRPSRKPKPKANKEIEVPTIKEEKTVEELEKEGAQNFARCLLGILPSVLSATEPSVTDEALQQFSSDVCEAVTCLALRRKNVPNFGTVRQHDIKQDESENNYDEDPSLNADGVYKTVYETLHLSFRLNKSGFYKKKMMCIPITQVRYFYLHFSYPIKHWADNHNSTTTATTQGTSPPNFCHRS